MTNLSGLNVGDMVMIFSGSWGVEVPRKEKVTRVLKTQVILSDGSRWSMTGSRVGAGTWGRERARPLDEALYQERLAKFKEARLKNSVCRFFGGRACDKLTPDQWERVDAICNETNEGPT